MGLWSCNNVHLMQKLFYNTPYLYNLAKLYHYKKNVPKSTYWCLSAWPKKLVLQHAIGEIGQGKPGYFPVVRHHGSKTIKMCHGGRVYHTYVLNVPSIMCGISGMSLGGLQHGVRKNGR